MPRLFVARSTGDLVADRRYAYAQAYLDEGDALAAAELAEQAVERAGDFAPAFALIGRARLALGETEAATAAFRRALAIEPEDELGVSIELARLGVVAEREAITPAYVRALFDSYADTFDDHLTEALGYRGPQLVLRALEAVAPGARHADCLDLGCGTGLVGEAVRPLVDRLAGVDIAPAMVEKAREKGVYDALAVGELTRHLAEAVAPASLDLLLAADVLIYIGDPAQVLAGAARALRPGGLFAFTAQSPPPGSDEAAGFALGEDARFGHDAGFLRARALACGLDVAFRRDASARREGGEPIPGFVMVLRRR